MEGFVKVDVSGQSVSLIYDATFLLLKLTAVIDNNPLISEGIEIRPRYQRARSFWSHSVLKTTIFLLMSILQVELA